MAGGIADGVLAEHWDVLQDERPGSGLVAKRITDVRREIPGMTAHCLAGWRTPG